MTTRVRYVALRSIQVSCMYIRSNLLVSPYSLIFTAQRHLAFKHLFGLGQTDGIVTDIINTVPATQEGITQDGQRTNGLREVHAHEAADAGALDLQDIIIRTNSELVTSEGKGEIGQRIPLLTINAVLACEALGGTNFLVAVEMVSRRSRMRVGE